MSIGLVGDERFKHVSILVFRVHVHERRGDVDVRAGVVMPLPCGGFVRGVACTPGWAGKLWEAGDNVHVDRLVHTC